MAENNGILERRRATVLKYVLAGCSDAQVASLVARKNETISPQAVTSWRARHADELGVKLAEAERQAADYGIATKVNRIAAKDLRWQLLEQVRQARAQGQHGIETGLVVRTYKALGSGENMTIVEEYKVDDGLLSALERTERGAAEEMGQLPKAGEVNVHAGNGSKVLIVTSEEALGFK